jgi:hypothetical protein
VVFVCAAPGAAVGRFLSWNADCEGARKIAAFGAALATP